ncbi:MAG TPA: branched-chain amino acid ABC transporter permease [Anaerolineales bacterium]
MIKQFRTPIILGFTGGLVTFLFGGWSVAMLGLIIGLTLGFTTKREGKSEGFLKTGLQILPRAISSTVAFLLVTLIQNYLVQPALGNKPTSLSFTVQANLIGCIALILIAILSYGLYGLPSKKERTGRLILLGILIVIFPFLDAQANLGWTSQLIFALIFVILGLGLNIVVGYAGLLDLGYAAFFAIGAYTAGMLNSPLHNIHINFWIVIWIGAAVAAIAGLLLGSPTLGLRGDYLAIVTLGFGEIVPVLFQNLKQVTVNEPFSCWIIPGIQKLFGAASTVSCINLFNNPNLTGAALGITPIGRPWFPMFGQLPTDLSSIHYSLSLGKNLYFYIGEFNAQFPIPWYFLILAIILFTIFFASRLRDSRLGRAWMAIREDELAAEQMGIDPVRTKLLAFAMGATFSGFAGAFYGSYIRGIFPSVFDFSTSIIILCIVILGGIGNINGVIVGGLVITTADRLFLPALKDFLASLLNHTILPALSSQPVLQAAVAQNANPILWRPFLFGLTLVIMMAVRPEGLIPSAQRRMELHGADEAPNVAASASMKS